MDVGFIGGYVMVSLLVYGVLRAILLYRNIELSSDIPIGVLFNSFVMGMRFDLIVTSFFSLPIVLAMILPWGLGKRKLALYWLCLSGSVVIFLGVMELEFYHEFHARLNSLVFQYIKEDPTTVVSMIWHGFPVIRYLLLWLVLVIVYAYSLSLLNKAMKKQADKKTPLAIRALIVPLMLVLVVYGFRGTFRSGPPLRWGDAFQSQYLFANHLALNGTFTLAKAILKSSNKTLGKEWLQVMPVAEALQRNKKQLITAQDTWISSEQYPILRRHSPINRLPTAPKNIVIIMMESFSAEFVGVLGHPFNITPEFDKLAAKGLLFDHFFSNGTHTHQGMFASVACFPNLPGFEYLMQTPEGQHSFSGLPALLKPLGFSDVYVYNGDFSWDNQEGFFRNQGMSRFIGRDAYVNPIFIDPTWGVSDQDMFNKAVDELDHLAQGQPFFAVLQTLSNHTPYALPDDLPVAEVTRFGGLNQHLTAQRYSDYALGAFFTQVQNKPWFKDTVFFVLGDHGFGVHNQLTPMDILRFHVPLLIIGPGIRENYGAINTTVASQLDIVPTAVGLLGKPFDHQCWGRNILSLPAQDPGFAIIKPSGSDQTVAFLQGHDILIKAPGVAPSLGHFSLYPNEYVAQQNREEAKKAMSATLGAFLQTALQSLHAGRTGLPSQQNKHE